MQEKQIFVKRNEKIEGPLEKSHFKDLVRSQVLLLTDEVGPTREGPWKTGKDIPSLVSQMEQSSNDSYSKDYETNGLVSPTPDNSKNLQNDESVLFAGNAGFSLFAAVLAYLFVFPLFGIGQTWFWSGIWVTIIFFFGYGSNVFGKAQDLVEASLLFGIPICGLLTVSSWLVGFPISFQPHDEVSFARYMEGNWKRIYSESKTITYPNGETESVPAVYESMKVIYNPTREQHGTISRTQSNKPEISWDYAFIIDPFKDGKAFINDTKYTGRYSATSNTNGGIDLKLTNPFGVGGPKPAWFISRNKLGFGFDKDQDPFIRQ